MSVEFEQIRIEPAYRKVAAAIGERILSRALSAGERLPPETELARQFGVNRSTVREALRELESRGLLRRAPGSKRMSVSRPGRASIAAGVGDALLLHDVTVREVWEALTVIEPPLARLAARAHTSADLAALRAGMAAFRAAPRDRGAAAHAAAEVFRAIGAAAHNPVLALAQEPLLRLLEPSLRGMMAQLPQARARIATAHERLHEALAGRDAEAAEGWMARHVRDFRRGFELAGIDLELRVNADE
ncbi:MAG: FadR family transcriptional regulator [Gammaproteobacteria bacterium]|nr:FadR family transcriptional regulator [Gammaproteobacteria bacterium]